MLFIRVVDYVLDHIIHSHFKQQLPALDMNSNNVLFKTEEYLCHLLIKAPKPMSKTEVAQPDNVQAKGKKNKGKGTGPEEEKEKEILKDAPKKVLKEVSKEESLAEQQLALDNSELIINMTWLKFINLPKEELTSIINSKVKALGGVLDTYKLIIVLRLRKNIETLKSQAKEELERRDAGESFNYSIDDKLLAKIGSEVQDARDLAKLAEQELGTTHLYGLYHKCGPGMTGILLTRIEGALKNCHEFLKDVETEMPASLRKAYPLFDRKFQKIEDYDFITRSDVASIDYVIRSFDSNRADSVSEQKNRQQIKLDLRDARCKKEIYGESISLEGDFLFFLDSRELSAVEMARRFTPMYDTTMVKSLLATATSSLPAGLKLASLPEAPNLAAHYHQQHEALPEEARKQHAAVCLLK